MSRYIDADVVLKEVEELKKSPWYNDDYGFGTKQARQDGVGVVVDLCIKQAPTADVVKVVKCTHCKYCKQDDYWRHELYCSKMSDDYHTHWVPVGFYCGYGEEIEDD